MIWKYIKSKLESGNRVALLVVVDSKGSSPGRKGFKMAIIDDGEMYGSIGGGVMEYNLVEIAKKRLIKDEGIFIKRQNHNSANGMESSGMICSGSQIIAFFPLDKTSLPQVNLIVGADEGEVEFNQSGFHYMKESDTTQQFVTNIIADNKWTFREQIGFQERLFVFGGGHVSIAVSKLFNELGFQVNVFDNRDSNLETFRKNTFASSKKIIDYKKADKYVPEGDNVYVVIITFSHKTDGIVLKSLIDKDVRYIGLMGSSKKISLMFDNLTKSGFSAETLAKIDAPIGIPIKSQTPLEVAISIAAKIISIKND